MVLDFTDIKRVVSGWIDENLDHRMILHRDDPAARRWSELGEPMYLIDSNPTAENIARLIFDYAQRPGLSRGRDHAVGNAALLRDVSGIALKCAGRFAAQLRGPGKMSNSPGDP